MPVLLVGTLAALVAAMTIILAIRHPPSTPLFPYTTLFRSRAAGDCHQFQERPAAFGRDGGVERAAGGDPGSAAFAASQRSEEHTSELQSRFDLVCRLLLEKKKNIGIADGGLGERQAARSSP